MLDNPKYNLKYIPAQDAMGQPKDTFFTSLPQTQDEIDGLSIDSADYQIKNYIQDVLENKNFSKKQIS